MKQIKLYLLIGLFLTTGFAFGQSSNQFMVTQSSGSNTLSSGTKLTVGSIVALKSSDKIKVANQLIMRHLSSGGTIKITEAGDYAASELISNLEARQQSTGSKLITYVANKTGAGNDNYQRHMRVTGSVERTYENPDAVQFYIGKKYSVYNTSNVRIMWEALEGANAYTVELRNMFGETVETETVTDLFYTFTLDDRFDLTGDLIAFAVVYKEGSEAPVDYDLQLEVSPLCPDILSLVDSEYTSEFAAAATTAADKILEANFFESRGLYADAGRCYSEAIDLAETDEEKTAYQTIYDNFVKEIVPAAENENSQMNQGGTSGCN